MYDNQELTVQWLQHFPRQITWRTAAITHHIRNRHLRVSNIVISLHISTVCTRYITKRTTCVNNVWDPIPDRRVELAEEIIAFIGNGHSAFIWVNGAEGEIFSCSLTLCQHVEKGWLPGNKNSREVTPSQSAGVSWWLERVLLGLFKDLREICETWKMIYFSP